MKRLIFAAGLLVAGMSALQAAEPSARKLKRCPNGHTTLKEVPIVYGLMAMGDAEGKGKADEMESVAGGCVIMPNSPKQVVKCTTCRFTYSIPSTDSPKEGRWRLSASDPAVFQIPLSEFVRSFPLPAKSQMKKAPTYTQSLDREYRAESESILYETERSTGKLVDQITEWLKERNLNPRPVQENSGRAEGTRTSWNGEKYAVWAYDHPVKKSTMYSPALIGESFRGAVLA